MASQPGLWQGTATQLLDAVGAEGVSVATFGKHLAQHTDFMLSRSIVYKRQHTRGGTILTLSRTKADDGENRGGGDAGKA